MIFLIINQFTVTSLYRCASAIKETITICIFIEKWDSFSAALEFYDNLMDSESKNIKTM